jgi:hypothetical protein
MQDIPIAKLKAIMIIAVFLVVLFAGWQLTRSYRVHTAKVRIGETCDMSASLTANPKAARETAASSTNSALCDRPSVPAM